MLKNPFHPEEPKKAYAYLQSRGTLTIDEIADHMVSHGCPYDRGDIVAIIIKLVTCTKELMQDGYIVQLGDLGTLRLTCRSEGALTLRKFTRNNIREINVRYRPSKQWENINSQVSLHKVLPRRVSDAAMEAILDGDTSVDWGEGD
jgi:predicted histone-like DNA-binding protein